MTITTILSILSFMKKNWGLLLAIGLAAALFISTFYFKFYIMRIENKMEDLVEENENLTATNLLFQDEIKQANTTIERLNIYSNSYNKIKATTNFYIPEETSKVILDINYDFYSNRAKNFGNTGLNFELTKLTNKTEDGK